MRIATPTAALLGTARPADAAARPQGERAALLVVLLAAGAAGWLVTDPVSAARAAAAAGPELTRLLRAMAALKVLLAAGAAAGVLWRLAVPAGAGWLSAYCAAAAAMAAGPGLIWQMAHVRTGAVLLHGGLLATVLLLWRDPGTRRHLNAVLAARRLRLRQNAA